jgi:hypothetical protein
VEHGHVAEILRLRALEPKNLFSSLFLVFL